MNRHTSQKRIVEEYTRLSDDYDTKWPFYIDATSRETLARLTLRPGDQILDVGCGTGVFLHHLATIHPPAQLSGVDPVSAMLKVARHKLSPAIALYQGWAEQLPFADALFDTVVCCNVFHFIGRPVEALGEIRRVLRPRGNLIITDWCGDYLTCRAVDRYQRLRGRAHAQVYRARDCVRLVEDAGYVTVDIDTYKINWLWGLMTAGFTKETI